MDKLITVQKALTIVENAKQNLGLESIPLDQASGRILAEDLTSDRPLPPYDRVTMDGISIHFDQFNQGQRVFQKEDISPAGHPQKSLSQIEHCIEVMTGTSLPKNTNTVIRYEDLVIEENQFTIIREDIKEGQNVHIKGSDIGLNELICKKGIKLKSPHIGIAASIGKDKILVKKLPRTCVISTGDELVEINQVPQNHQIRKSNIYALDSFLKGHSIHADKYHFADNKSEIKKALATILENYELIILSGGVSKGKFDFIPETFQELDLDKKIHGVLQRPGKPLFFGTKGKSVVFGLPGNPVSSICSAHVYISHWLEASLEINKEEKEIAELAEDYYFKPDLHRFLPVKLSPNKNGTLLASPLVGNGSGDFVGIHSANGILEIPTGKSKFKKGEKFEFIRMH